MITIYRQPTWVHNVPILKLPASWPRPFTAGARYATKLGAVALEPCTYTLNWSQLGRALLPSRYPAAIIVDILCVSANNVAQPSVWCCRCWLLQDNIAVAAACKNLTTNRDGQRVAAAPSWQFEDHHSQLWSSVNLFHGLNAEQKSAIKMALEKRRFLPGKKLPL